MGVSPNREEFARRQAVIMRLIVCAAVAATASAFVAPGPSQAARQAVRISASREASTCRRRGDGELPASFSKRDPVTNWRVSGTVVGCEVAGVENTQEMRLCSRRRLQLVQESRQKGVAKRSAHLLVSHSR